MNDERRNAPRKSSRATIEVIDDITGHNIGRIGNLSRTGMMLLCEQPLQDGALYQLRLQMPGHSLVRTQIETGVQTMWTEGTSASGQQWAGLRIISISAPAAEWLDKWLGKDNA